MSLYNMVLGYHPLVGDLLIALGYTKETCKDIPRFRDCYLFPDEIRLLTRTGGGNRPDYIDENQMLRERPGFLRDWNDSYDSTFAWWAYEWPDNGTRALQIMLEVLQENHPDLLPQNLKSRFDDAIGKMEKN